MGLHVYVNERESEMDNSLEILLEFFWTRQPFKNF